MNSFNLCIFVKLFISYPIVNHNPAGESILGCHWQHPCWWGSVCGYQQAVGPGDLPMGTNWWGHGQGELVECCLWCCPVSLLDLQLVDWHVCAWALLLAALSMCKEEMQTMVFASTSNPKRSYSSTPAKQWVLEC